MGENVANNIPDRRLITRIYTEHLQHNNKTENSIKNEKSTWIENFSKIYKLPIDRWKDAQQH